MLFDGYAHEIHKEYLRGLKNKYSIIQKSDPRISGKSVSELMRLGRGYDRGLVKDAVELLSEIKLHEVYFSSFGDAAGRRCPELGSKISLPSLFYEISRCAMGMRYGFVSLAMAGGDITVNCSEKNEEHFIKGEPRLAIDLCEHAYFIEYGFDKERYLGGCLRHLDLSRLKNDEA